MREFLGYAPDRRLSEPHKINALLERYSNQGPFYVAPVEDSGFVIQRGPRPPSPKADWVFLDLDDTLIATTEVKKARQQLLTSYIQDGLGIELPESAIEDIMSATDKFARWQEREGSGDMYHFPVHILALSWAVEVLENTEKGALSEAPLRIERTLDRIKAQSETPARQAREPFFFDDGIFTLGPNHENLWAEDIAQIMNVTMVHPPAFPEVLQAINLLKQSSDEEGFNIGIFTYGDQYFQLLKVLELLQEYPELEVSQIWLSKVPKGAFIEKALASDVTHNLYLSSHPDERPEFNELFPRHRGTPLGRAPQTIIFLDDSPKELDGVDASNRNIHTSGSIFTPVRSLRSGIKEEQNEWGGEFVIDVRSAQSAETMVRDIKHMRETVWDQRLKQSARYENKAPLVRMDQSVSEDSPLSLLFVGTDRDYVSYGLLDEAQVVLLQQLQGEEVVVLVGHEQYIYQYEENEDQSFFARRFIGKLAAASTTGITLQDPIETSFYELDTPEGRTKEKKGSVIIPYYHHDYGFRSRATKEKIARIEGPNYRLDLSNPPMLRGRNAPVF